MKCLASMVTVGGSLYDQYLAPTVNPGLERALISPPPFCISQSSRCWQPLYDRCDGGTYGRNINREFHAGVTAPKFVQIDLKIGLSCIVAFFFFLLLLPCQCRFPWYTSQFRGERMSESAGPKRRHRDIGAFFSFYFARYRKPELELSE